MTDRELVEDFLGRKLLHYEEVTYQDGCPWNGDINNLQITSRVVAIGRKLGYRVPGAKKNWKPKECTICGATIIRTGWKVRKTCSAKCKALLMSRINRKPEAAHSLYKDGATESRVKRQKEALKSSERYVRGLKKEIYDKG
jgi:predicted nucleic acid-binding Zn ribbon protein